MNISYLFSIMWCPESISHTLYPWARNTGYEIRQTQDSLDYPAKAEGGDNKQIALDMKISRRRVQQIWKCYMESKQEPAIDENMGRPRKPFDEREAEVIGEVRQAKGSNIIRHFFNLDDEQRIDTPIISVSS
jgi:hypothetical protein